MVLVKIKCGHCRKEYRLDHGEDLFRCPLCGYPIVMDFKEFFEDLFWKE